MNKLIIAILFLVSQSLYAGSYIMTKHELKSKDSDYDKTVHQIRLGYDEKINSWHIYGEIGGGEQLPNGKSIGSGTSLLTYEFGATNKITDRFSFKVKWEGKDYTDSYLDHKIEIKTKYRF